jgi:hypothetical protein
MTTITLQSSDFGHYRLVGDDGTSDVLPQTDYDFPSVASSFGWSVRNVSRPTLDSERFALPIQCLHDGTDGTIDCSGCTATVSDFISSARQWLDEHLGETVEDPGYLS